MTVITRNQMKNSTIINTNITSINSNIIQENSMEKQPGRNLRNKKNVDYSGMDMPIYLCPESMNSIRELSTLQETPIYETFNADLYNNPKLSNIIKFQYYMEREDPDYIFEEDYDDDELEESVNLDLQKNIDDETINNIKNMKEFKMKILEKRQAKNIEQNNKENIVMNIDDETMNNIKNMKEFKTKILEKKQAKNVTYIPGVVNSVKDVIPTSECPKKNIFVSIDQAEINYIRSLPGFKNRVYLPGGVNLAKDCIPTRKCAKNISYR